MAKLKWDDLDRDEQVRIKDITYGPRDKRDVPVGDRPVFSKIKPLPGRE